MLGLPQRPAVEDIVIKWDPESMVQDYYYTIFNLYNFGCMMGDKDMRCFWAKTYITYHLNYWYESLLV